jgi:hypothetical protein
MEIRLHKPLNFKTMRKSITLLVCLAYLMFMIVDHVNAQWTTSGTNIYNTNTGNVGISTTAPVKLLDVAKSMGEPTIRVYNLGGGGGATFEMQDMTSGADWKFKATATGGFKVRDQAMGIDVLTIEQSALLNALYIEAGGNVGLGFSNPLEKLDVNGAVRVGTTTTVNTGTIRWNGAHFQGYTGATWTNLEERSRVRAFQPEGVQVIPPSVWTPVNFTFDLPIPLGWDNYGEFTVAPAAGAPTPPLNAFFTVLETGFYQVNARIEFQVPYPGEGMVDPFSFISVAIYRGTSPTTQSSHAIGNNLAISYMGPGGQPMTICMNNAPNVSDVVYLMAGEVLSIWAWQSALVPLPLIPGSDRIYVSIHKQS